MRYLVLLFLCFSAIIAYIQRTGVNSVKQPICGDLGINTEDFGIIGSAWLVGYALMQVPAGWLADRYGGRNVLAALAVVWSILTGVIGWCTTFEAFLVVWFLMGMALAGIFPCAAKLIGAWFPDTEKAMASGLLGSATMLGNALAGWLTVRMVDDLKFSWQTTYVAYGAIGVFWAGAYLLSIRERVGPQAVSTPMARADWTRMAGSISLWLLCGQQFFRAGAMIFFINWFPVFLREERGFTQKGAGDGAFWVGLAAMTGGICGGFFSDWLFRRTGWRRLCRQGIALVGMTAAGGLVLASRLISDNSVALAIFMVGAFIASFGGVSGWTVAIEFGGRRIGVVFSMMNMAGNFGGAIVNFVAGSLTERTGSWDAALLVVAGVFFVDSICWVLLNPKQPLFVDPALPVDDTGIRVGEPPARRGDSEEHHEPR